MSNAPVYDDFCTKVTAFAAGLSPALPVSYPGVKFDPPTAGPWLEVRWFPNKTINYGMANDAPSLAQGIAQLSACYRPGVGIVEPLDLVDLIIAAFPKGTLLVDVRVYEIPWVTSVVVQPDYLMLPVSIPWRGFNA